MKGRRPDWPAVRRVIPVLLLAAVCMAHATMREAPSVMTAARKRELPVYNVDTQEKVLSISFDAAWGRANTEEILKQEVGKVFMEVLEDAGVYKNTPEGIAAFDRFMLTAGCLRK